MLARVRKWRMDRKRRKKKHTQRERERERELLLYVQAKRGHIYREKWLKDGQRVRRFNDESVRMRPLIVMERTVASATGGGELDVDMEEMQEMEVDAECEKLERNLMRVTRRKESLRKY